MLVSAMCDPVIGVCYVIPYSRELFFVTLEGQLTPLQAYQVIRNCGSQLLYERPEKRVELAHYMWDKIIETGKYCNCLLFLTLLPVT